MVEGIKELVEMLEARFGWWGRQLGSATLIGGCWSIIGLGIYSAYTTIVGPAYHLIEANYDKTAVLQFAANAVIWFAVLVASLLGFLWASNRFLRPREKRLADGYKTLAAMTAEMNELIDRYSSIVNEAREDQT